MAQNTERSVLSREYVVECLLMLLEKKKILCGDLSEIIKSGTTRKYTVKIMKEAGLVRVEVVNRPRKTYTITLTNTGMDVARKLSEAENVMSGNAGGMHINHIAPEVERDTATGDR